MNKITLSIIQGISGTVGFGILLFYGYSSKTAFAFMVLLSLPYILSRIAIKESQTIPTKKERPKMTISSLFTFLAIVFGFLACALAVTKIDKKSFQTIMENKPFLVAFYFCFISALIADTANKPENIRQ
ncbi:MAG: hypothetical protein HZA15_15650 [Nitrospirae bacterium]|nr:hypothetical protein [Nitrospirota bacterium]